MSNVDTKRLLDLCQYGATHDRIAGEMRRPATVVNRSLAVLTRWSLEKDATIIEGRYKRPPETWDSISSRIGCEAQACEDRFKCLIEWTDKEDEKLRELRKVQPPCSWDRIAALTGKTTDICRSRGRVVLQLPEVQPWRDVIYRSEIDEQSRKHLEEFFKPYYHDLQVSEIQILDAIRTADTMWVQFACPPTPLDKHRHDYYEPYHIIQREMIVGYLVSMPVTNYEAILQFKQGCSRCAVCVYSLSEICLTLSRRMRSHVYPWAVVANDAYITTTFAPYHGRSDLQSHA